MQEEGGGGMTERAHERERERERPRQEGEGRKRGLWNRVETRKMGDRGKTGKGVER